MKNYKGLTDVEVGQSRERFGKNVLTPPPSVPIWKLFLEKFKDPIIMILVVAAVISVGVGFYHNDFIESIGIIVAILLATGAGFYMEYSAKRKFDALEKGSSDSEKVKVIRNGSITEVERQYLVVDDIVILSAGDEIPADIKILESIDIKVDESTMTGESVPASKKAPVNEEPWTGSGFPYYSLLRSTKITEGSGIGIVTSVGDKTEIGKTTRQAMEETDLETPLNKQLNGLADLIGKSAYVIAGLLFLFLNIHHFAFTDFDSSFSSILSEELKYVMMAIVLIVVAVPEGLPLSTTLALAFSMKTMAKENNLVKKMHACETIGAVNIIFTDKTGTLTQNKMTVVDSDFKSEERMILNCNINSTANLNGDKVIGNPTEGAMIQYLNKKGHNYQEYRNNYTVREQLPFNSTNKYMKTVIADKDATPVRGELPNLVLIKGAPEIVVKMCSDSLVIPTEKERILLMVELQQKRGRRAISMISGSDEDNLNYDGTLFIEDPVREDVPAAIKQSYGAGVDVVMMTGDNIKTASEIASQAGFKDVWAIEAKDWIEANERVEGFYFSSKCGGMTSGKERQFPNVIARCKPEDKLQIMKEVQSHGYVCAMTGDGVNDSPSLNHADVGIAMGSGTSVAKEAADIVLLDDAFPSIMTGMKWGRSLYKNIQSFLFFQLSINVSACLIALFGPILGIDMPFTVTQFLWVNLVMDTIAALCLASEPADSNVLYEKPRDPKEFILTKLLKRCILGFGITMFVAMSLIILDMKNGVNGVGALTGLDRTEFFAIFMVLNWWNIFNARVIGKNRSIFHDLFKNKKFVIGSLIILVGTILIVQYGGKVFETRPLSVTEWIIIIAASSPVVIVRELWFRLRSKK